MSEAERAADEADGEQAWRFLTYQQFLRSYPDEDAIYEEYDEQRKRLRLASCLNPQHMPRNT